MVTDQNGYALYFPAALIPYPAMRNLDAKVWKHIGIYAYKRDFLLKFAALLPTPLEKVEGLEQLRALENRVKIKVLATDFQGVGIDTRERSGTGQRNLWQADCRRKGAVTHANRQDRTL